MTKDGIMADEAFWSKLKPEQQEEAKRLLGKEKGGTGLPLVGDREAATAAAAKFTPAAVAASIGSSEKKQQKEASMFDDYD